MRAALVVVPGFLMVVAVSATPQGSRTTREAREDETPVLEQVSKVNARMQNAGSLNSEELAEVLRLIHELEPKLTIFETQVQDEFRRHRKVVARTLALRLHDEAKGFAAANGGKPRQALVKYHRAEDEVRKLLDRAYVESNEAAARARRVASLAPAAAEAKEAFDLFEQHYRDIVAESDVLSAAAFHPVAIEQVPWTDLLTADTQWSIAALTGFEHRIENGTMVIQGPDASTRKQGVMSVGDKEQWRDFVLDFEFTFESGAMTMYFRLGKTIMNTESMTMESYAAGSAPPLQGKSYQGEASLIGSRFRFHLKAEGCEPNESESKWVNSRKGAFGLVIPDGTRVKFTRLRVRVLR